MLSSDEDDGEVAKISWETVRNDFNDLAAVLHYTRAAQEIGLWRSERILIERHLPNPAARLLEAGCGAGRVTLGLWQLGFRRITAFDFAEELLDQARSLARLQCAEAIRFVNADATDLRSKAAEIEADAPFDGALFMFNGLMQIPGRGRRRSALRELGRLCRPGAPLLFTTHDRDSSALERGLWRLEASRWEAGQQDPRLVEFGDRYFEDEAGRTFMHLPVRKEVLEDLAATGWTQEYDEMRSRIAGESKAVRDFSDECRFWVARRG
jgi:ubiquinone/menaquinone biosynthesis C-methylase UbiE